MHKYYSGSQLCNVHLATQVLILATQVLILATQVLHSFVFVGLPSLRLLNLSHNSLHTISSGAFVLPKLQVTALHCTAHCTNIQLKLISNISPPSMLVMSRHMTVHAGADLFQYFSHFNDFTLCPCRCWTCPTTPWPRRSSTSSTPAPASTPSGKPSPSPTPSGNTGPT